MTRQELIKAICDYIKSIAAKIVEQPTSDDFSRGFKRFIIEIQSVSYATEQQLKTYLDPLIRDFFRKRTESSESKSFYSRNLMFFAAIKLLHHVIYNQPLDLEETEEAFLNDVLKEENSDLNKLFLRCNEYLSARPVLSNSAASTTAKPDTKAESKKDEEKISLESIKDAILNAVKILICTNQSIEYMFSKINRLAELFDDSFLIELQNLPLLLPDLLEKVFLDNPGYSLAVWDRINDFKLIAKMRGFFIKQNIKHILRLVETEDDFRSIVYPIPEDFDWPLEFTERCFHRQDIGIKAWREMPPDDTHVNGYIAESSLPFKVFANLINSPKAALEASSRSVFRTGDLVDLYTVTNPYPLVNIVTYKPAAICLFAFSYATDAYSLIHVSESFIGFADYQKEQHVSVMLCHPEIFTAVCNGLQTFKPEQIEELQSSNNEYRLPRYRFLIKMLLNTLPPRKSTAVVTEISSAPSRIQNDEKLTIDDFKAKENEANFVELLKNKNIAESWFQRLFKNDMTAFIDILSRLSHHANEKNTPILAMLEHQTVLTMAIEAIDPANIRKLFLIQHHSFDITWALLAIRPDKILTFVKHAFKTAEDFMLFAQETSLIVSIDMREYPDNLLNIKLALNHEPVIAYIAGLFTTMQQLIEFRALRLGHIHPVYFIAEWLINNDQQVAVIFENDPAQQLIVFREQFHGYRNILRLDDRLINLLTSLLHHRESEILDIVSDFILDTPEVLYTENFSFTTPNLKFLVSPDIIKVAVPWIVTTNPDGGLIKFAINDTHNYTDDKDKDKDKDEDDDEDEQIDNQVAPPTAKP